MASLRTFIFARDYNQSPLTFKIERVHPHYGQHMCLVWWQYSLLFITLTILFQYLPIMTLTCDLENLKGSYSDYGKYMCHENALYHFMVSIVFAKSKCDRPQKHYYIHSATYIALERLHVSWFLINLRTTQNSDYTTSCDTIFQYALTNFVLD